MKQKFTRAVFLLLSILLLAAGTLPVVSALEPSYTPSASYRASTYYENLKKLPVTGDLAFDTVSVALSQIGYHEGSGTSQLGGAATGSGNYTEYNLAFGKIGGSYGYAWCAAFVSWCLVQSGAKNSAGGLFASCTLWVDELRAIGQYRTRSSGYVPREGDLIFFRSAGTTRASDHVGLVRYVDGGRVYTIEGNSSDEVSLRSYSLKDTYIVGYGLPEYGVRKSIDRVAAEDNATGVYAVTYEFLNVRAAASASATKKGVLDGGELVLVRAVSNGWGEIEYAGGIGYISLDYADFVAPFVHRIRYVSQGKEVLVTQHFSTEAPRVATLLPEHEGYDFLHWESGGALYHTNDMLLAGDRTLTAVFEERIVAIPPEQESPEISEEIRNEEINVALPVPDKEANEESSHLPSRALAVRHAGVVSGMLAAAFLVIWLLTYKRATE